MMDYWSCCLLELQEMHVIRFQFCINDNADVLVRIRPKSESYKHIIEKLRVFDAEFDLDEDYVKKVFAE